MLLYQSQQSKQFKKFIEDCNRHPEISKLDLTGFLIKPVQRICRYPLLLREIIKYTPESHRDHSNLVLSLQKISSIVAIVNESTPKAENVSLMVEIQNRFLEKFNILTPTRRLLRTDPFYVLTEQEEKKLKGKAFSKKDHLRELFLFNDLFIITKPARDDKLALIKMCACESINYSEMEAQDGLHRFFIGNEVPGQPAFICATPDPLVKAEWKLQLKGIRDDVVKRKMTREREKKQAELLGAAKEKPYRRVSGTTSTDVPSVSPHVESPLRKSTSVGEDLPSAMVDIGVDEALFQDLETSVYVNLPCCPPFSRQPLSDTRLPFFASIMPSTCSTSPHRSWQRSSPV